MCWLYAPEDKHNDRAIITLYQLKKNANVPLANIAASDTDVLLHGYSMVKWTRYGSSRCEYSGFSTQVAF